MPSPIHLERHWLMDTFGCFLQYDAMSQRLITTSFTTQSFPNLFTFVPVPKQFPHRAILRLTNAIPSAIPPTRFVRIDDHAIAIQNIETNRYLCSQKNKIDTTWEEHIDKWERFTLLSKEMIIGLSILSDPDLVEIPSQAGPSHLTFCKADGLLGSFAKITDVNIELAENLSEIAKLAKCKAYEEITLSFKRNAETDETLNLKIIPKRTLGLLNFNF